MDKDKEIKEKCETTDKSDKSGDVQNGDTDAVEQPENGSQKKEELENKELEDLKSQLNDKTRQCEEYFNMLQRMAAEFDNYKKRTAREKEAVYTEVMGDVILAFLPVLDNLERAINTSEKPHESQALKEGVELVLRQFKEILKKLGVEEIKSVGASFDPQLHNAVMHIEDDSFGENVIVEEYQKGYILKDRVIRHSMVKVAN